ncbi:MAG: hypothetical protein M1820_009724 [Bogoriella megaspora]|nr:MAG: hypothetical protein M1820_009724 [Bogoriella megaspora]
MALSTEVHKRGMYLMVDVVVNHFGWYGRETQIQYNELVPFDDPKYYHPYCLVSDYKDANDTVLQNCWLGDNTVTLPDLRTEDDDVIETYSSWIEGLVSNYSVDGLRIDSALNVDPSFFDSFVPASGVFATGELMNGVTFTACGYQHAIGSVLNYPTYYPLIRAFESPTGSIGQLVDQINGVKATCSDPTTLGTFSENHDVSRFASSTDDMALAKNVIAYTLLTDGIPILYQGQEQHLSGNDTPYNREAIWTTKYNTTSPLYTFVQTLNQIRAQAVVASENYTIYNNYVIYQDLHTLAMRKGFNDSQMITILSNLGVFGSNYNLSLTQAETGFRPGTALTELLSCTNTTIGTYGNLTIPMGQGLPKVYYPTNLLSGSGMCGTLKTASTKSGFASPTASPTPSSTATPSGAVGSRTGPCWLHMFAITLSVLFLQDSLL